MTQTMYNDNTAAMLGGGLFGGTFSMKVWALQITTSFPTEIAMKVCATIILSCVGGVFGLLAKDVYVHLIKPRIKIFNKK